MSTLDQMFVVPCFHILQIPACGTGEQSMFERHEQKGYLVKSLSNKCQYLPHCCIPNPHKTLLMYQSYSRID